MPDQSPWKTAAEAGKRINKSKRFVLKEVSAGRLRAARIGGRGEVLTTDGWLDQYVQEQSVPVAARRRA